jgi:hypothetical protein
VIRSEGTEQPFDGQRSVDRGKLGVLAGNAGHFSRQVDAVNDLVDWADDANLAPSKPIDLLETPPDITDDQWRRLPCPTKATFGRRGGGYKSGVSYVCGDGTRPRRWPTSSCRPSSAARPPGC